MAVEPTNTLEAAAYRHVLLPVDGSKLSAAALPTAQALAKRFGAELTLLAVLQPGRTDSGELLNLIDESFVDFPDPPPVEVAVADDPSQEIVAQAAALEKSIVCMSTIGRGRLSGAVLGSTTRAVLQTTQQPLVAVGPNADRPGLLGRPPRRPAGWPEPLSIPRVVACVDGSKTSEAVLPDAAAWAAALDAELVILTVSADNPATLDGKSRNTFGPADPTSYVNDLASRFQGPIRAVGHVTEDPISVHAGVKTYLDHNPASLVALTTHARSGWSRMRVGATGADIVRTSTIPALVVPLTPA